jgi:hypothetical protein
MNQGIVLSTISWRLGIDFHFVSIPRKMVRHEFLLQFLVFIPPVFLFPILQLFQVSTETETVMTRNQFTTVLALPSFFLIIKKFLHSIFFNEIQVFYHAHSATGSVSFVNFSQSVTWKASTLKTESHIAL